MTTDYDTPDLAEVIEDAIESRLLDVHVALPGRVRTYDAAAQTAQIELGVRRVLETDAGAPVAESMPILENVPVAFPRGFNAFLTFPLYDSEIGGAYGLVVFPEASIDQWRAKGEPTAPGDRRRHSLTGAVFYPGLVPAAQALTDPDLDTVTTLGYIGGAQVRIASGAVHITSNGASSAAQAVALANLVLAELQAIKTSFDAHVHPDPLAGVTGVPTVPLGAPGSVASSNLKAD